jgi:hypothetical protein
VAADDSMIREEERKSLATKYGSNSSRKKQEVGGTNKK